MKQDDELEPVRLRFAEHQRKTDDAHRAIGRYIVQFSQLVMRMRQLIEERLRRQNDSPDLMAMALGNMAAGEIAALFFGLCKSITALDGDELVISKRLAEKVGFWAIPARNDIAHGDWIVELSSMIRGPGPATYITRTSTKTGVGRHATERTPADLDGMSDQLERLCLAVMEFGMICFELHPLQVDGSHPKLTVSDIFTVEGPKTKRRIFRHGPAAGAISFGLGGPPNGI